MKRRLFATLTGLALMAGCGVAAPGGQQGAPVAPTAQSLTIQHMHHGMGRAFADLDLTDKQREAIKAIRKEYRCGATKTEAAEAVKAALLAPTVDKAALAAAITAKVADRGTKVDRKVTMLGAIRDVLTEEQRAKFGAKMTKAGDDGKDSKDGRRQGRMARKFDRMVKDLNLTDEQRQAFMAVRDAFKANREAMKANAATAHEAVATFMKDGDAAALRTALMGIKPNLPITEMVNAAASLDQEQRQKLVDKMAKHHAKRCDKPDKQSMASEEDQDQAMPAREVANAAAQPMAADDGQAGEESED